MGTRFAAIALPRLRVEIARAALAESDARAALAVVIARPGGAVQRETDLLGNTRLDEVSTEAHALGVRAGNTIAAARAKYADLRVRVVAMNAVHGALARVAESSLSFGATTAFDVASDVVWIDVTGCGHLWGGEMNLASRLAARVAALGHVARIAIADGPRVAAAVAKHAPSRRAGPFVVPPGKNVHAIRVLPLAALPLDEEAIAWLLHVGMKTAGDLQALPRRSLGMRLGIRCAEVMALLRGDDSAPLAPYQPPEVPEERAELEYGITSTEALLFVVKTLCDRLAARLEGRAMAAARLELELSLDRAMLRDEDTEGGHIEPRTTLALAMPSPIVRASDLLAVLRARVDSYAIAAPILAATLRAPELAANAGRSLHLFEAEPRADAVLPRLTAELAAELGESQVGVLELADTWIAEERSRLVPHSRSRSRSRSRSPCASTRPLVSAAIEPSRFVRAPAVMTFEQASRGKHVGRIEAAEWWRRGLESRDVALVWCERERALAWVEIDRASKRAVVRGFVD